MAVAEYCTNAVCAIALGLFYIAITFILTGLTIVVSTLFVELLAARRAKEQIFDAAFRAPSWPRVAVLVPAHNESVGIIPTLADAKSQLRPTDRLLVVADNCNDDTAEVARAQGADVVERNVPECRGKGFALSEGVAHLSKDPPDIVIVIDADCRISPGAIRRLAATAAEFKRATQANYIMRAPTGAALSYNVAEFAWRVKNFARPLGLLSLGCPCQLTGSGMAFPWAAISSARLATSNIVEDMALGIELALRGEPPLFCPTAEVSSTFPASRKGIESQRRRWKHGHLKTIASSVGPLIVSGVANASLTRIIFALDLAVPPLSALVFLTSAITALCFALLMLGFSAAPFCVAAADAALLLAAVALAWADHGRDVLPINAVPQIAPYLIGQMNIFQSILRAKGPAQWTPTDRK